MKKYLFALVLLAFAVPVLAQPVSPHGLAFTASPVTSWEEAIELIDTCAERPKKLRATCQQILDAYNQAYGSKFKEAPFADQHVLAGFLRDTTTLRVCYAEVGTKIRTARLYQGIVDMNFHREFRDGEKCLYSTLYSRDIAILSCLQPTPDAAVVFVSTREQSISDAAKAAAGKVKPERDDHDGDDHQPGFFSWKKPSGKLFWITAIAAGTVGGVCAATGNCVMSEAKAIAIATVR